MNTTAAVLDHDEAEAHHDLSDKTALGFWLYLMTDCVLFATLFATFAVLRNNTGAGESRAEMFNLSFVFIETILLLVSSLTAGMAVAALRTGSKQLVSWLLGLTFLFGAGFVGMEIYEFTKLVNEGNGPHAGALHSAYFVLVGTHGLHIVVGLLWIIALVTWILRRGITGTFRKRLGLFSLFWHFLDIIWIFIFTIVYLFGVLAI